MCQFTRRLDKALRQASITQLRHAKLVARPVLSVASIRQRRSTVLSDGERKSTLSALVYNKLRALKQQLTEDVANLKF